MPFYVGIGVDTKRAYSKTHRNSHWKSIVSSCDYDVHVLFDDVDYEFAKQKEMEFIEIYKRKSDGGTLCNITLGGDGVLGIVHTDEAKEKMGAPNKGKVISEWHRKRISEFHTGKVVSKETKKKMSDSVSGEKNHAYRKTASEETRDKMRASAKRGPDNKASKLTESNVIQIRSLHVGGQSKRSIAKQFGVCKTTIQCIINRETWRHI
jgi:group I intron endonuclease